MHIKVKFKAIQTTYTSPEDAINGAYAEHAKTDLPSLTRALQDETLIDGHFGYGACGIQFSSKRWLLIQSHKLTITWSMLDAWSPSTPAMVPSTLISNSSEFEFNPTDMLHSLIGSPFDKLFQTSGHLLLYTKGNDILAFWPAQNQDDESDFLYAYFTD